LFVQWSITCWEPSPWDAFHNQLFFANQTHYLFCHSCSKAPTASSNTSNWRGGDPASGMGFRLPRVMTELPRVMVEPSLVCLEDLPLRDSNLLVLHKPSRLKLPLSSVFKSK
jgi:hypothetical protein